MPVLGSTAFMILRTAQWPHKVHIVAATFPGIFQLKAIVCFQQSIDFHIREESESSEI